MMLHMLQPRYHLLATICLKNKIKINAIQNCGETEMKKLLKGMKKNGPM